METLDQVLAADAVEDLTSGKATLLNLTRGLCAVIDTADLPRASTYSWCVTECNGKLYAKANVGRGQSYLHRFVMRGQMGDCKLVDHRNGNGLDNRRSNLRPATHGQNVANQKPRISVRKHSKFKGVSLIVRRKPWIAYINANGKRHNLGYFASPEEAAKAYDDAAKQLHGEFASLNFASGSASE